MTVTGLRSQTLYRFWDSGGDLLYVGISVRPWDRWKQHRGDKPWWEEVASVTLQNFATREDVEAAEIAAIRSENPRYNIAGRASLLANAAEVAVDAEWDGVHEPVIAYMGDLYYCSCTPPDWDSCPEIPSPSQADTPGFLERHDTDLAAWQQRWLMPPSAYSQHVIEAVLGERFPVTSLGEDFDHL